MTNLNKKDDKNKAVVLRGISYYASVVHPNKTFDPWSYQISVLLDKDSLKKAKELNLNIKPAKADIPGEYIQLNRKVKDQTNPGLSRPEIVGTSENPYKMGSLVGNGSEVIVRGMIKDRTGSNGKQRKEEFKKAVLSRDYSYGYLRELILTEKKE